MSWLDKTFMRLDEVLAVSSPCNDELLADLQQAAYRAKLNGMSMFKLGEPVELPMYTSNEEKLSVYGVVVGIRFSVEQVRYDIAIPCENSPLWMVLHDFRDEMRSLETGKETEFIDSRVAAALIKRALPTTLTVVKDEE